MARIYATVDDFNQSPYNEDDDGDILKVTLGRLRRASNDVDHLLLTAQYKVDDDGYAVDPRKKAAITAATCAQAAWGVMTGDASGAQAIMGPISLGPLSLGSRTTAGTTQSTQSAQAIRMSPEAITELTNAGLIPGQVWHD